VLNAANEAAVAAFLAGRVAFLDIASIVGKVMSRYAPPAPVSLDDVFAIDAAARREAETIMERLAA
jgi:1-deoxy-D-xylulose-5-phosphate reductoisomerase